MMTKEFCEHCVPIARDLIKATKKIKEQEKLLDVALTILMKKFILDKPEKYSAKFYDKMLEGFTEIFMEAYSNAHNKFTPNERSELINNKISIISQICTSFENASRFLGIENNE